LCANFSSNLLCYADPCKGQGIKRCSFGSGTTTPDLYLNSPGHFVSFPSPQTSNSQREVFLKTLAFYCSLREYGCLFQVANDASQGHHEMEPVQYQQCTGDENEEDELDNNANFWITVESNLDSYEVLQDCQAHSQNAAVAHCNGNLVFC